MRDEEILGVSLPKWPACATVGKRVTPDQAAEIIVRCSGEGLFTNDRVWEKEVLQAMGLPGSGEWGMDSQRARQKRREELRCVELNYMSLGTRIAAAYIGGPHGWVDWDGAIGESGHNIGKWPTADAVFEDWKAIASAFPFLSMRCQLFSGESCEDGVIPVIEYVIEGGEANVRLPVSAMTLYPANFSVAMFLGLMAPGGERGCTLDQLRRGVKLAEGVQPEKGFD